ncbi:MAG TPA: NADH-quinone oxidoreductase subunit C [Mycobacteriales bacterium]|nr:NADH-quinone oxidoreductase subunit C [Mycobacteriales bacterium]
MIAGATETVAFGQRTVDVPAASWVAAATAARDERGLDCFDWLSAVDELDRFDVVLAVYSVSPLTRVRLRTRVDRDEPRLASVTGVFAGAAWHERETHEMFGIDFDGHPGPAPLLLPDGFSGHPLRKDFVLAARVAKAWPGEKEPGGVAARRRVRPPGVPEGWADE